MPGLLRIRTIQEYHQLMRLPKPAHPLVSVVRFEDVGRIPGDEPVSLVLEFYSIALKRNFPGKVKYGQQVYDFDEGIMTFMAPGQVFRIEIPEEEELKHTGWLLLLHPDFLWNTPMAKKIREYDFFGYAVHEALFLSDKEETALKELMYSANIDAFSHQVITAQLELLLTYAERFYSRQFLTRRVTNHRLLEQLEDILNHYFEGEKGIPTVSYLAAQLNISVSYLGSLLKVLTGQSPRQLIHDKLIEKAKEKLSTTQMSVSEIAYWLGFEHPQSFSKLFKAKTSQSPQQFRQSFN